MLAKQILATLALALSVAAVPIPDGSSPAPSNPLEGITGALGSLPSSGTGAGSGIGNGSGDGNGNASGSGNGSANQAGNGSGNGSGDGNSAGNGSGSGDGNGNQAGNGSGSGNSAGNGNTGIGSVSVPILSNDSCTEPSQSGVVNIEKRNLPRSGTVSRDSPPPSQSGVVNVGPVLC